MHGAYKYKMYLASLDVKTAFDVVKPGVIAEILKETGGHEWMSAALLEEMKNLKGKAFKSCETECRYSRCIRQGSAEVPSG